MEEIKVEYIEENVLKPFDSNTNYLKLIKKLHNDLNDYEAAWHVKFEAINDYRRMLKYNKDLFYDSFHTVIEFIPNLMLSFRSNLSKITLILISEIYSVFVFKLIDRWTPLLLPNVLAKACSDKSFIRTVSLKCLDNVTHNAFYMETFIVFLEETKNVNQKISELSADSLIKLIKNINLIWMVNIVDFELLLKLLYDIVMMKKDLYLKRALKIFQCLICKLDEEYLSLIKDADLKKFELIQSKCKELEEKQSKKNKENKSISVKMLINSQNS